MSVTFRIFPDGRAAGSAPVSGSDFVTKDYLTSSISNLSSSLTEVILENEEVTAAALNDLNGRVSDLDDMSVELSGSLGAKQDYFANVSTNSNKTTLTLPTGVASVGFSVESTSSLVVEAGGICLLSGSSGGGYVKGVAAPIRPNDATNKSYVDSEVNRLEQSASLGISANNWVSTNSASVETVVSESVLSTTVRHIQSISSASYAALDPPDPDTLYVITGSVKLTPDVVYQTDGTTGLLGHNSSSFADNWQLENLDLTPYTCIECYFKASATSDADKYTPAVVVKVPLDEAAKGPTAYFGGVMVALPFNRNREYLVGVAVDATKTKFQVVHQNTLWDITTSDANNTGRYLYKILGYYN